MNPVKTFMVSAENLAIVAKDDRLNPLDTKVLMLIMSEHRYGPFDKGQEWIAQQLDAHSGNVRKSCQKLEELQYIIRIKERGAVISIMIHPFFMFNGRRNQEDRHMEKTSSQLIRDRRKEFYRKIEAGWNPPNHDKAIWPGLGPNGTDWVYEEKADGKEEDPDGQGR
jgi:hypothetical protein